MHSANANTVIWPHPSFFESITSYTSNCPQSNTRLRQFGYAIDHLALPQWLEVGYAVSDIRFALAYPLIYLVTEQTIGREWEQLCRYLVADGQRYAAAVDDSHQVRKAFRGGKYIWKIGHGVAGAAAELLAGDTLQKRGMPPMFLPLFERAGIDGRAATGPAQYH